MPITVQWDNEAKTIVLWTFEGRWSWDEFRAQQAASVALLSSVSHRVHVIADLSQSSQIPRDAFSNYQVSETASAPNRGRTVVVAPQNIFVQTAIATYNKIVNPTFLLADSVGEARALLAKENVSS
jgi:hypothetical protein